MIAQYKVAPVSLSKTYFSDSAKMFSPQDEALKLHRSYINMFLDVDFGLAMLLAEMFDYNQADIRSVVLKSGKKNVPLHELSITEKIDVCKQGLKKFNREVFEEYAEDLERLDVFNTWKNLFVYHNHSGMQRNEMNSFEDLLNNYKLNSGNYNTERLWEDILSYRQSIMKTLKTLHGIVVPYASPL